MELQELVNIFNDALNKEGKEVINGETQFKDCDNWNSMSAFTICAVLDEKFGVKLRGIQIRKCNTINDLYNLIKG